jgi:hypothetical protein
MFLRQKTRLTYIKKRVKKSVFSIPGYLSFLVFSLLISLFKIFDYEINEIYLAVKTFPYEIYDIGNCNKNDSYCLLFRGLNIVNDFIKDVLIIFLNALIDIILFKNSKDNLRLKKKLTKDANKLTAAIELKNKLNRMIFINGVVFIIAYLPEFLVYIMLIAFDKQLNIFCDQYMSCREFTEFGQIFNYISFFFQFFILKKFNKNFNHNYIHLKNEYFWKKFRPEKVLETPKSA